MERPDFGSRSFWKILPVAARLSGPQHLRHDQNFGARRKTGDGPHDEASPWSRRSRVFDTPIQSPAGRSFRRTRALRDSAEFGRTRG